MKVPTYLKHKPIIIVNDYDQIEKPNGTSDAKALSLGKAQYDQSKISAKVWRKNTSTGKWSPQSEELPLPRNLDVSIFILIWLLWYKGENISCLTNSSNQILSSISPSILEQVKGMKPEDFKIYMERKDKGNGSEKEEDSIEKRIEALKEVLKLFK